MKAAELKPLCHFKFFPRIRHLRIRKNDRLFLGEMKDGALAAHFGIAADQPQLVIERDGKPAAVLFCVEIDVRIHKDGKEEQKRPEKERIYKKFAHNRNMGEFPKTMKFQSILTISVSSSPFRKSGIS